MFTSRAEYRLLLRADNADARLTPLGRAAGLVGDARHATFERKAAAVERGMRRLRGFQLPNSEWHARGFGVKPSGQRRSAEAVLSVPNAELADVEAAMAECAHGWVADGAPPAGEPPLPSLGRESVEIRVKYAKYLERQEKEVKRMQANAHARIPDDLEYASLPCLSAEEVEKLSAARPPTLEAAGAIPGITPKALLYIAQAVQDASRRRGQQQAAAPEQRRDGVGVPS